MLQYCGSSPLFRSFCLAGPPEPAADREVTFLLRFAMADRGPPGGSSSRLEDAHKIGPSPQLHAAPLRPPLPARQFLQARSSLWKRYWIRRKQQTATKSSSWVAAAAAVDRRSQSSWATMSGSARMRRKAIGLMVGAGFVCGAADCDAMPRRAHRRCQGALRLRHGCRLGETAPVLLPRTISADDEEWIENDEDNMWWEHDAGDMQWELEEWDEEEEEEEVRRARGPWLRLAAAPPTTPPLCFPVLVLHIRPTTGSLLVPACQRSGWRAVFTQRAPWICVYTPAARSCCRRRRLAVSRATSQVCGAGGAASSVRRSCPLRLRCHRRAFFFVSKVLPSRAACITTSDACVLLRGHAAAEEAAAQRLAEETAGRHVERGWASYAVQTT